MNHQCWQVSVAVQRGTAEKQRLDALSPATKCTLCPGDQPLPSEAPRSQKPRQLFADGSTPDILTKDV